MQKSLWKKTLTIYQCRFEYQQQGQSKEGYQYRFDDPAIYDLVAYLNLPLRSSHQCQAHTWTV